jgi:prepilin-type N-terminal cleavage/methylation domain-containing protein
MKPAIQRRRPAFTLVEMLVTMALVVFIMAILAEAFGLAMHTFRTLKALGDMDERLRSASNQLRDDLQADHFDGRRRLGDPNFWAAGPPREGFFRLSCPTTPMLWVPPAPRPPSYIEGFDGDGIPSAVATDMVLHFSVKQRGNKQEKFFTASIPPGSPLVSPTVSTNYDQGGGLFGDTRFQDPNGTSYSTQWAEVMYFLVPNGESTGSTPLYTLYRAQLAVTPDNSQVNGAPGGPVPASQLNNGGAPGPNYLGVSCEPNATNPTTLYFNTPIDLAGVYIDPNVPANTAPNSLPNRALDPNPLITNPTPPPPSLPNPNYPVNQPDPNTQPDPTTMGMPRGSAFVLGDVISFEVQVLTPALGPTFGYIPAFDTAAQLSPTPLPFQFPISALQITLRVWDLKTLQTRQVTIVVEM